MTPSAPGAVAARHRLRIELAGAVQGVGFRPFVHRLASRLALSGTVSNSGTGVTIHVEGAGPLLDEFVHRLSAEAPPLARIDDTGIFRVHPTGQRGFDIVPSRPEGTLSAAILPDVATCADCLCEILDPADRRFRYPFTNCTNCGPRFSIVESLPYDRAGTTMRGFVMCAACGREYHDPADRRFHAQPNACPACGPRLTLTDPDGGVLAQGDAALLAAADHLREGRVVALKGLGGFQLLVGAAEAGPVDRLRRRKRRPDKPFAVMAPSMAWIETHCEPTGAERQLLRSARAPIVLIRRGPCSGVLARSVAPRNPLLGVMLPYTPAHHLLMQALGVPLVATSGNLSGEPLAISGEEARARLGGIADVFLDHDRPIARPLDDSVVRVVAGRTLRLRLARGYAPLRVRLRSAPPPMVALGGHRKSAAAVAVGRHVVLGPHVGDLDTTPARRAFDRSVQQLRDLHGVRPRLIACDAHPGYYTSSVPCGDRARRVEVPHHAAHVLACAADNGVDGPVLGVAWDGSGYGPDGTLWGGEFLVIDGTAVRHVARLRRFMLPGGDAAVVEPRRAAVGALHELLGGALWNRKDIPAVASFTEVERLVIGRMLARSLNAPITSSAGRLFDAAAALMGLIDCTSFEGQGAMAVEFALPEVMPNRAYPIALHPPDRTGAAVVDWGPMLAALVADVVAGVEPGNVAAAFHNGLVDAIVAVAHHAGVPQVVLAGGCFQNRSLTEGAVVALQSAGFEPLWHRNAPPNDGALALGQAVWAARLSCEGAA